MLITRRAYVCVFWLTAFAFVGTTVQATVLQGRGSVWLLPVYQWLAVALTVVTTLTYKMVGHGWLSSIFEGLFAPFIPWGAYQFYSLGKQYREMYPLSYSDVRRSLKGKTFRKFMQQQAARSELDLMIESVGIESYMRLTSKKIAKDLEDDFIEMAVTDERVWAQDSRDILDWLFEVAVKVAQENGVAIEPIHVYEVFMYLCCRLALRISQSDVMKSVAFSN
jgi:hypothetical protein